MADLFERPKLSNQIQQIQQKQHDALRNLNFAINAVNESIDLSSASFEKFSTYSKQVERIRNTIQETYFRIDKLKSRVEEHKAINIPKEHKTNKEEDSNALVDVD